MATFIWREKFHSYGLRLWAANNSCGKLCKILPIAISCLYLATVAICMSTCLHAHALSYVF